MAYNGWTNYATWNVNLWIENTEAYYYEKQRWLRCAGREIDAEDVAWFYLVVLNGTTPDLRNYHHVEAINFAVSSSF